MFPGFYFCLTDPGLGAREAGNPETPKGVDKNKLLKKPALSNQSRQLPYSGQTQGNKLAAPPLLHSLSRECRCPPSAGCNEVPGFPNPPPLVGIREDRNGNWSQPSGNKYPHQLWYQWKSSREQYQGAPSSSHIGTCQQRSGGEPEIPPLTINKHPETIAE